MSRERSISKYFSFWKIMLPVAIGVGISVYLIVSSIDSISFSNVVFSSRMFFWLMAALLMMLMRDAANIYRIKSLTGDVLTWKSGFQVVMLWEFSSALTPSVIGGSVVAWLMLYKEKMSLGRSTAIVMITSFLDELFFLIFTPLVILTCGGLASVFDSRITLFNYDFSGVAVFLIGYIYIAILASIIVIAVVLAPKSFGNLIKKIFSLSFLKKWKGKAEKFERDLVLCSAEIREHSFWFWLKMFGVTAVAWFSRFSILVFIILAFAPVPNVSTIYSQEFIMWVVLMISPTPGGSGIAEMIFGGYMGAFIAVGIVPVLSVLWRLMTYYNYIIAGSIVLPLWTKRVFSKNDK